MEAITTLRQTTIVATYLTQFEVLSNRLRGLFQNYKVSCFLSGLEDEIRLPLRMLKPHNLNLAFGLAKIQEEYVYSSGRLNKPPNPYISPSPWVLMGEGALVPLVWRLGRNFQFLKGFLIRENFSFKMLVPHRWRKWWTMGCTIIAMRSGTPLINAES